MPEHASIDRSNALGDPRFLIAAGRRMLYRNGIDSQVAGHISLRVPGEDAFLVSPSEYFDETLPGHILKVGFDLEVLEPGPFPPQPGINFHADIYRARPDVNCIIHTHGRNVSIVSTLGKVPEPFHAYGALFQDDIVLFRDDPNITPDKEGPQIAAALADKRAALIANHGVIHVGGTIEETVGEALMLDIAAGVQIEAARIGGTPMAVETARTYRGLYLAISFRKDLWDANMRRLEKSDPDLFAIAPLN